MKNWKTKSGYEIFRVLHGRSNAFLICTEKFNLLVDTGIISAYDRLQRNISTLNLPSNSIDFLILTHSHYDHCQSVNVIQKQYNCKTIQSENETEFTRLGYAPLPDGTNLLTRLIANLGKNLGQKYFRFSPFIADILFNDQLDLNSFGLNIRLIHTTGHSPGSISVIVDNEIALVGDAMFGIFRNSIFPPFADDISGMIKSWGVLLKTECKVFLPGHGNEISRALVQNEFDKFSQKPRYQ